MRLIKSDLKMKLILFVVLMLMFVNCSAQQANQAPIQELKRKVADQSYPKIDEIIVQQGNEIIMEAYFNGFGR